MIGAASEAVSDRKTKAILAGLDKYDTASRRDS
jgi:hypothetical protein